MDNSEIRPFSSESTESDITPDPTTAQELEKAVDILAKLTSLECEKYRKTTAKQFAIRASSLDGMVKERKRELANAAAGNEILSPAPEPWPTPVDGEQLLDSIRAVFRRHLVLPDHADTALTLWSVGTYVYNSFRAWPRLLVTSPEKRCGKTTCLEILESIARRSLSASNITPAAMFRSINELSPTLLIDEADTFLKNNVELQCIINSGHARRGAFVVRCEGDDHQTKRFSTWCPMGIFMIRMPAGTIVDRSVIIQLRRKLPNETVQRLPADLYESGESIRQQAERWAQDHEETLKKAELVLPDCENDRALDNWRPLFSIAETAGGDWPNLVRQSFSALTEIDDGDAPGPLLLHDIRGIFQTVGRNSIFSRDLLDLLIEIEESPWAEWHRGKPITARGIAKQLRPYGVSSHGTIRIGRLTGKGYLLANFQDAFQRYLPEKTVSLPVTPIPSVTTSQVNDDGASSQYLSVTQKTNVTDKKTLQPCNGTGCDGVTDKTGWEEDENIFRGLDTEILDCVAKLPSPTIADLVRSIYRIQNDPEKTRQCFEKIRGRVARLISEDRIMREGTGYKLRPKNQ